MASASRPGKAKLRVLLTRFSGWPLNFAPGILSSMPRLRTAASFSMRERSLRPFSSRTRTASPKPMMPAVFSVPARSPRSWRPPWTNGQIVGAAADIEGADPLGAVDLMGRDGQEVDPELAGVDVDLAEGLDGVGVDGDVALVGDPDDLGDRLNGADLVVGVHDRDEPRLRGQGRAEMVEADRAEGVDGQIGDLDASLLQGLGRLDDGRVLDRGGDEFVPLRGRVEGPEDGEVVGLGARAGEKDLAPVDAQGGRHPLAGLGHELLDPPADRIERGGIAEMLAEEPGHLLGDGRVDGVVALWSR